MRIFVLDTSLRETGYALVDMPLVARPDGVLLDPCAEVGEERRKIFGQINIKDARLPLNDRVATLCARLEAILEPLRGTDAWPSCVLAETPAHTLGDGLTGKGAWAIQAQQRCFGAVAQWLGHKVGLPFGEVSPAAAKGAATGESRATKAAVRAALTILFSGRPAEQGGRLPRGWTNAVVDALTCAFYADAQLRLGLAGERHDLEHVVQGQIFVPGASLRADPEYRERAPGEAPPTRLPASAVPLDLRSS